MAGFITNFAPENKTDNHMATSIRLIRRYVWLVDTIRRAGSISLEDINSKWAYNTSLNVDNEDEIRWQAQQTASRYTP